jgi:Family of unknown function (DUF5343)
LDDNAVPTERYFAFLDQSQSKQVLAQAIREAYGDLFAVNVKANELTTSEVKNKLRTLTQGKNSEKVLGLMANTFKALVDYAEWVPDDKKVEEKKKEQGAGQKPQASGKELPAQPDLDDEPSIAGKLQKAQLHYNIQIHLPESRDQAVYDALFKSLKKHLF